VEIKQFAQSLGVTFPMLLCTDEVRSDYQVAVFPTTFLIDRQGRIRHRRVGALEAGYWQQKVEKLIADD
jgi:peroxiredoxin